MSMFTDIISAIGRHLIIRKSIEDVGADLDAKAAKSSEKLDWRNSVVDLLKLTGQDSSLQARKTMARGLGYTGELNGSAEMNDWLHEKVVDRLR